MRVPRGFKEMKGSATVVRIRDKYNNIYIQIPQNGNKHAFWISQYEISHKNNRVDVKHSAGSLEGEKPWVFINLYTARDVARQVGGRLPTEEEYERFLKFCMENHLIQDEEVFIWTETRAVDQKHYVSRKGNEKEICYPTRQTNHLSFRIVLETA